MSTTNEIFQDLALRTNDIVTPANVISATGFALAVNGARQMETMDGVLQMGTGRVLDMLDGKVARATGTSSDFGEMVDATLDKLAVATICYQGLRKNIIPKPLLASVAAQNAANAGLTLYDRRKNPDLSKIHPSKDGKHAMFSQNVAMGLFCLAEASKAPAARRGLRVAGWAMSAVATYKGIKATKGYYNQL